MGEGDVAYLSTPLDHFQYSTALFSNPSDSYIYSGLDYHNISSAISHQLKSPPLFLIRQENKNLLPTKDSRTQFSPKTSDLSYIFRFNVYTPLWTKKVKKKRPHFHTEKVKKVR